MLYECKRVLAPGGAFMLVTYGDPSTRLGYLEVFDWHSIQVSERVTARSRETDAPRSRWGVSQSRVLHSRIIYPAAFRPS